jgi:hypothetical protein
MTTTETTYHWAIATIGADSRPHRTGAATTHSAARLRALAAGRAALLAGELDDVAFTVDDDIPTALYTPAGEPGDYDAADITEDLLEIYQGMTAGGIIDQLVSEQA